MQGGSQSVSGEVWMGEPVRLLGIRTSKLSDENEPEQLTIFDMKPEAEPDEKHKRLRKAMDELNKKYGEAVIKASLMPKKNKYQNLVQNL